jgi:hypothetical protein
MSLASYRAAPPRVILQSGWIDGFRPSRTACVIGQVHYTRRPLLRKGRYARDEGCGARGEGATAFGRLREGRGQGEEGRGWQWSAAGGLDVARVPADRDRCGLQCVGLRTTFGRHWNIGSGLAKAGAAFIPRLRSSLGVCLLSPLTPRPSPLFLRPGPFFPRPTSPCPLPSLYCHLICSRFAEGE